MPSPVSPISSLLPEILKIEKAFQGAPGFSVGDTLEAVILRNAGSGKFLVSLNGSEAIRAESAVPLQTGETVRVRVEQLQPSMVLSLVDKGAAAAEAQRTGEFLRLARANPGALLNLISDLPAKFDLKSLAPFLPFLNGENIQNLLKLLDAMPLSSKTAEGNLFFRNYIESLGLLWESGLKKALKEGGVEPNKAGLKGALMTVAEEMSALAQKRDLFDVAALGRLKDLQRTAENSVRTLESGQVVNVLLQETENRYLLQIPFLFPDGTRMADLSIEYEGEGRKGEGGQGLRVLFLLDMDALGGLSVEANIAKKKLNCLFRCTDRGASGFITASFGRLEDALAGLGYEIGSLTCRYEEDLSDIREYFSLARGAGGQEAVNIFV